MQLSNSKKVMEYESELFHSVQGSILYAFCTAILLGELIKGQCHPFETSKRLIDSMLCHPRTNDQSQYV